MRGGQMKIFVAGASGAIGRRLVPLLTARGHSVVGTTRTAGKIGALRALGAEAIVLDGLDRAAVVGAIAQAAPDVVVHQMTALAEFTDFRRFDEGFAVTNRLRTEGMDNLLAAMRASGVPRIVAQSYAGWPVARTGGPIKDEDAPLDTDPPS